LNATFTLLDLAGSVALLLWGTHMVQTGVQRAFGPGLRRILGRALHGRGQAFLAGAGVTAVLQSSTATGLMVASFSANGLVDLVPGLAVMLGANVGTTLIVQVLSFDVARVAPVLVLIGVIMFRRGGATRTHDLGRVAIGLGLMLMALHELLVLVTPYEDVTSLRLLLGAVATEPVLDVLLAAALTWAAHSSVAVVLLTMSLAAKGAVPPDAAFALVLGANLGTAINPVLEGASGEDAAARRVTVGNLLNRLIGCGTVLALLAPIGRLLVQVVPETAREVADFHTAFNLASALVFLPLLGPYAALLRRWLPAGVAAADPSQPLHLDPNAAELPPLALAAAARESLRMADVLESMLHAASDALVGGDRKRIAETRRLDDVLDRLNAAIKSYLSTLDPEGLTEQDERRVVQILAFTTNLEHAGDVVDKNLMAHASKCLKQALSFSPQGRAQIADLLERLARNLRAAGAVFMTADPRAARELAGEKLVFRQVEGAATNAHFARLRAGRGITAAASTVQLDLVRDLGRINDHLVGSAAYPVLEEQGELLPTRLRAAGGDAVSG
jgi:phosphate:Na+ symporter